MTCASVPPTDLRNASSKFSLLLSPIKVGQVELRNRVVMGSLHTRLENEPNGIHKLAVFYETRARGGVGLIITGAVSPNRDGRVEEDGSVLDSDAALTEHRPIVQAVQRAGARIVMQILHAGINAKHADLVGPGNRPSPINARVPRALSAEEVESTIEDYVSCAQLAAAAGYDGVEVMGSEGYLINQFLSSHTNQRRDAWGGPLENRMRFPVQIVHRIRERLGPGFLLIYRVSAIDLVAGGLSGENIDRLARAVEKAGADALNTGVGWHESVVPTIATTVPRGAFAFASARLKGAVGIPVIASNRINMPDIAESILAAGSADLVSMARPLLADPDFVAKAAAGRDDEINTCIACNQACLDHIFTARLATCLVNPKACHETEFDDRLVQRRQRVAVVGAGPAGLSFASSAAARGHDVVLFESDSEIGGQLNLARRIPGKVREFGELIRYLRRQLQQNGVTLRTGIRADVSCLTSEQFDRVVIATGIRPRRLEIPGFDHPKVVSYADVITGKVVPGRRVAVIGTGGVGHDVAEFLTSSHLRDETVEEFLAIWGVDPSIAHAGGLRPTACVDVPREVTLFQRAAGRPGARLGKSTGWIHRAQLARRGVHTIVGCTYLQINDQGLHFSNDGKPQLCPVDQVVVCAGQEPEQALAQQLQSLGMTVHLIGGARAALELDAKKAIDEGMRLAFAL